MLDATRSASAQGAMEEAPRCPIREALTDIRFLAAQLLKEPPTQYPWPFGSARKSHSKGRNPAHARTQQHELVLVWKLSIERSSIIVCTSTRFGTTCIGLYVPRILRGPNDPL